MTKFCTSAAVQVAAVLVRVTVAVVILSACKSELASAAAAVSPASTRVETIQDPSLGMKAFDVTVPAKWHFQSVLEQGGQCVPTPFPVFRATSPDGLAFMERMPTMGWRWGTGPAMGNQVRDCLPLNGPMSARDYLKYLAPAMNVQYVADAPVPAKENAAAQQGLRDADAIYAPKYAASRLEAPKDTRELARALVRYRNGSFEMKGLLAVMVDCTETHFPGMKSVLRGMPDRPDSTVNHCSASVRYLTAPENQFQAIQAIWDAEGMGARGDRAWQQAWVQRNQQQANQVMAGIRADTAAAMQASAQRFQHDMAVQQHMHEQFMATMQRGTDMSMARTAQSMNARSTAASDWVDYALDQRTVRDPGTGQISKVSSSYSYTWVDSTGKTSYQTNDVNANPNGSLAGTWTRQQTVHGDGTN